LNITAIKEEDALHRAMQLQPERVVGEEAIVIDLDCMDFRHIDETQKTRPDGILCCRDR